MEKVSDVTKNESLKSLQSTIKKSEQALMNMNLKDSNTTLLRKRLNAFKISLALLEHSWDYRAHHFNKEDLEQTNEVLTGLLPTIEKIYIKSKIGSSNRTLLERRIKSFELSLQAIDDILSE